MPYTEFINEYDRFEIVSVEKEGGIKMVLCVGESDTNVNAIIIDRTTNKVTGGASFIKGKDTIPDNDLLKLYAVAGDGKSFSTFINELFEGDSYD